MAITKMSNLGIASTGSEKYNDMLAGNAPFIPSAYYSLASFTAVSGNTTVTFSSIPQTYRFLHIRISGSTNGGAVNTFNQDTNSIWMNADTNSANYNGNQIYSYANSTPAGGYSGTNGDGLFFGVNNSINGTQPVALSFNVTEVDIYDYAMTNKNKSAFVRQYAVGFTTAAQGFVSLRNSLWRSNSAVSSIRVDLAAGWATGTTIDLYGVE
jgi:hypothetical protein